MDESLNLGLIALAYLVGLLISYLLDILRRWRLRREIIRRYGGKVG